MLRPPLQELDSSASIVRPPLAQRDSEASARQSRWASQVSSRYWELLRPPLARAPPGQHLWIVGSKWVSLQDVQCVECSRPPLDLESSCRGLRSKSSNLSASVVRPPFAKRVLSFLVDYVTRPRRLALPLDWLHMWFRAWSHWRRSHSILTQHLIPFREPWLHT